MKLVKPECEHLIPPWKTIEITDKEWDEIILGYINYKEAQSNHRKNYYNGLVKTLPEEDKLPSQYLHEWIKSKQDMKAK